jgi:hypothetical protein
MKVCTKCGIKKPLEDFHANTTAKNGKRADCKKCVSYSHKIWWNKNADQQKIKNRDYKNDPIRRQKILDKQYLYKQNHREEVLLKAAIKKSKELALECNLTIDDIVVPEICPLLGIKISSNSNLKTRDNSPSIDRINPKRGYIKGNVWIVSYRANRIKNDATIQELYLITKNLHRKITQSQEVVKGDEETIIDIYEFAEQYL